MSTRAGFMLLAITWFCWGFSYPATAVVLESLDVWTTRSIIMVVGGALLLGVCLVRGISIRVPRAEWRDLAIAAVFNMTIFQTAMAFGVHFFSAGRTAVIVYTMPLWAILFAWLLLGERPGWPRLAALGLGLVGLAVLMSQSFPGLRYAPLGAGISLVAALAFGFGTVLMKRRRWTNDPAVLGGWQLILGSIPVIIGYAVMTPQVDFSAVRMDSWWSLAYLIVIANTLAYFAWFRAVAFFPATVSGVGAMAVPIVGVFASALLINEELGWRELTALGLICCAIAINLRAPVDRGTGGATVSKL